MYAVFNTRGVVSLNLQSNSRVSSVQIVSQPSLQKNELCLFCPSGKKKKKSNCQCCYKKENTLNQEYHVTSVNKEFMWEIEGLLLLLQCEKIPLSG